MAIHKGSSPSPPSSSSPLTVDTFIEGLGLLVLLLALYFGWAGLRFMYRHNLHSTHIRKED